MGVPSIVSAESEVQILANCGPVLEERAADALSVLATMAEQIDEILGRDVGAE